MINKTSYDYVNLRLSERLEGYQDYKNSELFKTKNEKLVHYSLTFKGSALYYQKLFILNLFRQSFIRDKLRFVDNSLVLGYFDSPRFINFGTSFQQKYCFLTTIQQIKRNTVIGIHANDSFAIGTFKNFANSSNWFFGNSFFNKTKDARRGFNQKRVSWFLKFARTGALSYLFMNKFPRADETLDMKSVFFIKNDQKIIKFGNEVEFAKFTEFLTRSLSSLTNFIRTVWFKLTSKFMVARSPVNTHDYSGICRTKVIKTEGLKMSFAAKIKNTLFLTLGSAPKRQVDLQKFLKINMRWNHRHFVKKHVSWRLGLNFWGRKILCFKKGYLFWQFARGLTHYYYRGYKVVSIFNNRADMYILRHFKILSLRFSRLLIQSRHVFLGNYPIRMRGTRIEKYNLLTLSKKATIYLTKKKYFKYWKNKRSRSSHRKQRFDIKNAPLRFCRQQKDLAFWGTIKNTKYILNYGSNLNLLNMASKKTRFFALNYFYVQKAVATAWW